MVVAPLSSADQNWLDDGDNREATVGDPDSGRHGSPWSGTHPQADRKQKDSLSRETQTGFEHEDQGVSRHKRHPRRILGRLNMFGGNQNWVRVVIWVVVAMMVLTLMAALLPTLG